MVELVDSILRSWQLFQLNSTSVEVSNCRESWHGVDLPSCRIYTFPSFCGRFSCPSTILITPSLSHDPIAIKALIISNCSHARLTVRSKPVRLNMRSGSDDIGGIVIKSRAMRASRGYRVPFTLACQYAIGSVH
jgi:hypothetical protein